jgi:PadR family transcriptional regulator PadR
MEVKGVLPMLVLSVIDSSPAYGGEIRERLRDHGEIRVDDGTLYPMLRKFQTEGLIKVAKVQEGPGRAVQRCTITERGRAYLADQRDLWRSSKERIERVLLVCDDVRLAPRVAAGNALESESPMRAKRAKRSLAG